MSTDSLQFRFMRFLHEMDFESQRKAEKFYKGFIVAVAILSYIIGSILQQFSTCVYSTLAAMVICCIWYLDRLPGGANPSPPSSPRPRVIDVIHWIPKLPAFKGDRKGIVLRLIKRWLRCDSHAKKQDIQNNKADPFLYTSYDGFTEGKLVGWSCDEC